MMDKFYLWDAPSLSIFLIERHRDTMKNKADVILRLCSQQTNTISV